MSLLFHPVLLFHFTPYLHHTHTYTCVQGHTHTRVCKDTRRGKEQEVPRGHERKEMIDGVAHAIDAVIDLEKKICLQLQIQPATLKLIFLLHL